MSDPASAPLPDEWLEPDHVAAAGVRKRAGEVLRPAGALERLDEVAVWLGGWQRTSEPRVQAAQCLIFAADHGLTAHEVSAYPSHVTEAMLRALRAGVATASVMCATLGIDLTVVDVGVGNPTGDIAHEPALTRARFEECWAAGSEAVAGLGRTDLLILGEMGIGNTTAAAAVCASLFGDEAGVWVGRGTGIDDAALIRKRRVVETARQRVGDGSPPLEVLREVGGSEMVAIAAAVCEARARSLPVVLDGYVVGAACSPLEVARPGALDHVVAGHCSAEPGHRRLLELLGKPPILDLGLRLGEASGALAAVPIIDLAARSVTGVATFAEWGLVR